MIEPWEDCTVCPPKPPEHDRMDYGYGPALVSTAAILLREIGADDSQVETICRALQKVKPSRARGKA